MSEYIVIKSGDGLQQFTERPDALMVFNGLCKTHENREDVDIYLAIVDSHTECQKADKDLGKELSSLRDLLREAYERLNFNKDSVIVHGDMLHLKLGRALKRE